MMRVLDLFSGIGGFSRGLERTDGFETVAFCEIDPFCRKVLAKRWPKVPCYDDVRELTGARLTADGIAVDVICGGFPCQDVSFAGKRAGLEGARSGLWSEYGRLVGELRPRFVVVENVPGLLSLGLGVVLGDLSALGYDAVWDCVPASAVGAPHRRDRVWLIAADATGGRHGCDGRGPPCGRQPDPEKPAMANAGCGRVQPERGAGQLPRPPGSTEGEGHQRERLRSISGRSRADVAHANGCGRPPRNGHLSPPEYGHPATAGGSDVICHPDRQSLAVGQGINGDDAEEFPAAVGADWWAAWWAAEPDVGRVAHGVPARVDRLRSLGNAVVPQIPEMIGHAILQAEAA